MIVRRHWKHIAMIGIASLTVWQTGVARGNQASASSASGPVLRGTRAMPPFFAVPDADGDMRFHARMPGAQVLFDSTGLTLGFSQAKTSGRTPTRKTPRQLDEPMFAPPIADAQDIVRLNYVAASASAHIEGTDPQPTKLNYYAGNDPTRWRSGLSTFNGIAYRDLYPGIDLMIARADTGLKSTYVVAPGLDPKQIRWRYEGAARPRLNTAKTTVVLDVPTGDATSAPRTLTETAPLAWQDRGGQRTLVPVRFDASADGSIGFDVDAYDPTLPLVIDPFLEYSTLFGGSGLDEIADIAVDGNGAAYVTGRTTSLDLPTTAGSWDRTFNGNVDAFIAKLNPAGSSFDYVTYIGGTAEDNGNAIALDSANNAVITGQVWSSDFPITAGVVETIPNYFAAFVVKVNQTGGLVFSTFLAGGGSLGHDVKLDSQNNIYVVGATASPTLNPTMGAFQATKKGIFDAFLAKLNPTATVALYKTYIGGSDIDEGIALDLNGPNQVFITGHTTSTDFPLANAFQPSRTNPTVKDAYVMRLDLSPSTLVFSTYLGGSSDDYGWSVAVGPSGSVYVAGTTDSTNFPVSPGAYDNNPAGGHAYVAKFTNTGARVYTMRLGNGDQVEGHGLAVDGQGKAHLAGLAVGGLPTVGAFVRPYFGAYDGYLAIVNADGTALEYLTYLGGSAADCLAPYNGDQCSVALGPGDANFVAGTTDSSNFPLTSNAPDKFIENNGMSDGFMLKISNNTYPIQGQIVNRYQPSLPSGISVAAEVGVDQTGSVAVDASGVYVMSPGAAGTYVIRPTITGASAGLYFFSPITRAVTVPPSAVSVNFDIVPVNPLYAISGHVRTESGLPLLKATVWASLGETAITDRLGAYTIPISLTGRYVVSASLAGYYGVPTTQIVQIPASAETTGVDFVMKPGTAPRNIFAPLLVRDFTQYYPSGTETEPNDSADQANGPIRSGATVSGFPNDLKDYFYFIVTKPGSIRIDLAQHTGGNVQLQLFHQVAGNVVVAAVHPPYQLAIDNAPVGKYYVYINTGSGYNSQTPYQLTMTYP